MSEYTFGELVWGGNNKELLFKKEFFKNAKQPPLEVLKTLIATESDQCLQCRKWAFGAIEKYSPEEQGISQGWGKLLGSILCRTFTSASKADGECIHNESNVYAFSSGVIAVSECNNFLYKRENVALCGRYRTRTIIKSFRDIEDVLLKEQQFINCCSEAERVMTGKKNIRDCNTDVLKKVVDRLFERASNNTNIVGYVKNNQLFLVVQKKFWGLIIGAKGCTIKSAEGLLGCRITLKNE